MMAKAEIDLPCPPDVAELVWKQAAEIERLRAALKPFADLADRKEYTLDDVPHGLFINAKLALRGIKVVGGIAQIGIEQLTTETK